MQLFQCPHKASQSVCCLILWIRWGLCFNTLKTASGENHPCWVTLPGTSCGSDNCLGTFSPTGSYRRGWWGPCLILPIHSPPKTHQVTILNGQKALRKPQKGDFCNCSTLWFHNLCILSDLKRIDGIFFKVNKQKKSLSGLYFLCNRVFLHHLQSTHSK